MTKKELRKIYTDKRNQLTPSQKQKLDDLILIQFQKLPLPYLQTILSFWPMQNRNEIDTHTITEFIVFRNPGIQVAYPVTDFSANEMHAVLTDDDTEFKQNEYTILEPVSGDTIIANEVDVILVPLLAFDKSGYRVGYGKGFYDRYLAGCKKDIIKIGLSYFDPEEKIDDIDQYDIKLSCCITPNNIFEF
jgi:5-formyltetrahydrofolate cyclo-ligase